MTYTKRITILLTVISLLLSLAIGISGSDAEHRAIYEATREYIKNLGTPSVGSVGGEWMVIALCRDGVECPDGYYENVVSYVTSKINEKSQLHKSKSTDNSRVILGLTAAGYDVTDVGGHNLLKGLTDMTYLKKQGINGPIWALIALDCKNYDIPEDLTASEQATREGIISYILEKQLEDGGWAMSGMTADPDMTGMAIQALAPYYDTNETVKEAVDKAIVRLSELQKEDGGYGSIDGICSESCAQVIVALTSLGIDPHTDERFIKNGMSVVDAMCTFAIEGGGFAHIPNATLNGMATEQGQYALVSYFRFLEGKTPIYDMTDVTAEEIIPPAEEDTTSPEDDTTAPEDDTTASEEQETTAPIEEDTTVPEDSSTVTDKSTDTSDTTADKVTTAAVTTKKDKSTTATTKPVVSPQTMDGGIALYITLAIITALGVIFTVYRRYRVN